MKKIATTLKLLFAYITICGLVMFPCFILEEAIQMTTFGTWPAADAQDWELMSEGVQTIKSINITMKIINYSVGWIQPLAFLSYRAFAKATDYYVQSLKAKIFAHSPETLIGHTITTTLSLRHARISENIYHLKNRSISITLKNPPDAPSIRVTATVHAAPHGVHLIPDLIHSVRK